MRDPCGSGSVLHLARVSVSILVGIMFYNFVRCRPWGNWVKGTWITSVLFLQLHVSLQLSQNLKSLIKKYRLDHAIPVSKTLQSLPCAPHGIRQSGTELHMTWSLQVLGFTSCHLPQLTLFNHISILAVPHTPNA